MTLQLKPETLDALAALAGTRGMSVEDFLEALVNRERSSSKSAATVLAHKPRLSPEEWAKQFDEWVDGPQAAPPIPDEALTRENLYPDRD